MVLLVLTYRYKNQDFITDFSIEIEHIFPKGAYLDEKEKAVLGQIYELIGNKTLLEKSINIKAGNKGYERKKEFYLRSKIQITKNFVDKYKQAKWNIEDIRDRDCELRKEIISILKNGKIFNF